jgi:hypothetical protein
MNNRLISIFPILSSILKTQQLGYYDPFMFATGESQETFDHLREVEIKHGRIGMLAVVGYLTTIAGIRFPGAEDIPAGFKAFSTLMDTADGQNVLGQMVLFIFLAEQCNRDVAGLSTFPGDYRNGFLDFGWDKLSEETKLKKRAIELNNGRAAQMGILGLMVHEQMGVSILPGNILP